MQDRYAGDLGDFGKYGLLRRLTSPGTHNATLRLGVDWRLVPDESHSNDGRFTGYLDPNARNQTLFRSCDPELYDALRQMVHTQTRSVAQVRNAGILPADTRYHEEPLSFHDIPPGPGSREKRTARRTRWLQAALDLTHDCDLVFFDPDNGLDTKTQPHHRTGPKYVFPDELQPYVQRGQSLVIYQHTNRTLPAAQQVSLRTQQLRQRFNLETWALTYRRGSSRTFLIAAAPAHAQRLKDITRQFLESPWALHFASP